MSKRFYGLTMAAALATIVVGGNAFAAGVKLLTTIDIPGEELKLFDIGVVDADAGRYYIADRSNKGVDIIDTKTNKFVGRIEGMVGVITKDGKPVGSASGPNGTALDMTKKELWIGDGDSTVKVVDLKANPPKISETIKTGGQKRADELAVDTKDGVVLVWNNADKPAFGTFISTATGHKILGKVEYPEASDGVEQSVFVAETGLFYSSVPELTDDKQKGGIAVFDPKSMKMLRMINIPGCGPTGLMQGPGTNMLVGCSAGAKGTPPATVVWDWKTEKVVNVVKEVGGMDEVWYDSGSAKYYTASRDNPGGPVLGVIDAKTNKWIENVPTAPGAHSVAADSKTKHVFVPLTANPACPKSCIGVYGEN